MNNDHAIQQWDEAINAKETLEQKVVDLKAKVVAKQLGIDD